MRRGGKSRRLDGGALCWSGLEILARTDASVGLIAAVELDAIFQPTRKCRKTTKAGDALNLAFGSHLLYSCLINPDDSNSWTRLISTKLFGSALAAFGVRGAMSSSKVFTPSALG